MHPVIEYCLRHKHISSAQYEQLCHKYKELVARDQKVSLDQLLCIALGWKKKRAQMIIKKAREVMAETSVTEENSSERALRLSQSFLAQVCQAEQIVKETVAQQNVPQQCEVKCEVNKERDLAKLPKGQPFGDYILVQKLGRGGMGEVFKAYHPVMEQFFAIKMLLAEQQQDECRLRFRREARVASKLRHPNIVQVHNVGTYAGRDYMVMDYIAGSDLAALLRKKRFWPRETIEIILQIAQALAYAHNQGVIHRDIKPSNILLTQEQGKPHAYLMDFGLAALVEEKGLTRTGQLLGTPQYMSPEQARGQKLDARSDIYSLGTVLYEMLAHRPVVKPDNAMVMIYQVVKHDVPLISQHVRGISREVAAITTKCLEKAPQRRYGDASELVADLSRYLRGEAVLAHTPGFFYRMRRKLRRYWLLVLSIVLIVAIMSGNVYLMMTANMRALVNKLEEFDHLEQHKSREELNTFVHHILSLCEVVLKSDPYDPIALKAQKRCRGELTHWHLEALVYYRQAQQIINNARLSWDDLKASHVLFVKATQADPNFDEAMFQAGRTAHIMFRIEEAYKYYKRVQRLGAAPQYYILELQLYFINLVAIDSEESFSKLRTSIDQMIAQIQATHPAAATPKNTSKNTHSEWDYCYYQLCLAQLYHTKSVLIKNYLGFCEKSNTKKPDKLIEQCDRYSNQAWDLCNQVLKKNSTFADAYFLRAQLKTNTNITHKIEDYTQGLQLEPFHTSAYFERGKLYHAIGAYSIAERDFTQAVRLGLLQQHHDIAKLFLARAICYVHLDKMQLALADLSQLDHQLSNKQPQISEKLLQTLKQMNISSFNFKDTISSYTKKISKPERANRLLLRVFLYMWLHKQQKADEALKQYLAIRQHRQAPYDSGIEGLLLFYIANNNQERERARQQLHKFFQNYQELRTKLKSFQPLLKELQRFLPHMENFFCIAPHLKMSCRRNVVLVKHFNKQIAASRNLKSSMDVEGEFTIIFKKHQEFLQHDANARTRHKLLDKFIRREFAPLNIDFFYQYVCIYLAQCHLLQNLANAPQLPTAYLYYRRAVDYYLNYKLEEAQHDLEAALELDPQYMPAYYGLSTIHALRARRKPQKNRELALFYLEQAIKTGWRHWQTYTLHDPDFKSLGLGSRIPLSKLQAWDRQRETKCSYHQGLRQQVEQLVAHGKALWALRLLYQNRNTLHSQELFNKIADRALQPWVKEMLQRCRSNAPKALKIQQQYRQRVKNWFGRQALVQWEWLTSKTQKFNK